MRLAGRSPRRSKIPEELATRLTDRLAILKDKMQTAAQLFEPLEYFVDEVLPLDGFLDLGESGRNAILERCVVEFGERALNLEDGPQVMALKLVSIPEYNFFHGTMSADGILGMVIYFTEIDVGVMSMSQLDGNAPTQFARFRAIELDPKEGSPGAGMRMHLGPSMRD
jgi:hypothetical protein